MTEAQPTGEAALDPHSGHRLWLLGGPLAFCRLPLNTELREGCACGAGETIGMVQRRPVGRTRRRCQSVHAAAQSHEPAFGDDLAQRAQDLAPSAQVSELTREKNVFAA